jgi:hypothetical protein
MDHTIVTKPCTAQDWASAMESGTDNARHHLAIDALALLLDNKASSSDTAGKSTTTYESSIKAFNNPDEVKREVSEFYALYLCDAIRSLGGASKRLIDLLLESSKRPDLETVDGTSERHRNGSVNWRDSPRWSYNFLEYGLR